jgi:SSS family transporter
MLWMILLISFPVIKYYLPYFRKLNVTSAYEILEQRFNLFTRLLASTLFCIFMIVRMAIVLYLPSLALTAVTGIDIYLCIVLMGLVTIIYCTMGGVEAVIWGDVVQGLILVFGAIFAVIYLAVNTEGGVMGCIDIALANDKLRLFDWSNSWSQACWWVIIIGGLANNLISYTSDQTVIQRYLTTPDEKSAGRGILVNGVMSVFVSVAFYMIGTGLYTFYKTHPVELDVTMGQSDAIFPFFMMSQMPAGIAGALIAAIFAATMSTISSNINSVATAFSIDFWKRFRRTTDSQLVVVARWASVVSGMIGLALALLMATWDIQSFLDFFNEALGLLTSGLGGLFFIAVFMKRVKGYAALTGFVVGEAVVFWMSECTEANFFLFGATGMVVSIVVAWLLSINSYFKKNE